MFVGNERRLGPREACQHCCLSTHSIIGLLQRGWERTGRARISMGGQRADSWVFLVAQDEAGPAFVCMPESQEQGKGRRKGNRSTPGRFNSRSSTIFSATFTPSPFGAHFSFTDCGVNRELLPLVSERASGEKQVITSISIPGDSAHLLVYRSRAGQGVISSPAQNAARVIVQSVKTQPVATWLVYTRGCSNNVLPWQAATTIFSPLFIHLLSHLALLVILALTLNQIYHAVRTVSVFILFSAALLLFYLGLSVSSLSFILSFVVVI